MENRRGELHPFAREAGLLLLFPYISGVSSCFITFFMGCMLLLMLDDDWREDTKVSLLVFLPREARGSCLC